MDTSAIITVVRDVTVAATKQATATEQLARTLEEEVVPIQLDIQAKLDDVANDTLPVIMQTLTAHSDTLTQILATTKLLADLIAKINALLSFFKILGTIIGVCMMLLGVYKALNLHFKVVP